MTKRKDWPETDPVTQAGSELLELTEATAAALGFLENMIANGGHTGPASDLQAVAARLRAAMYPAD